jgi:hypothetical protein
VNIHTICAWKYDWRCCAQFIAKSFMKLLYDQTPPKRAAKTTCSSCPSTNSISPLKRVLLVLGAQPLQGYWPLLSDLLAQLYVLVGMSSERGKKGQRPHNLVPTDDKNWWYWNLDRQFHAEENLRSLKQAGLEAYWGEPTGDTCDA